MKIRELLDKKIIRTPSRDFKRQTFNSKTSADYGTLNYSECLLSLADNLDESLALTSFFHEIGHAFLNECNIDLNTDKEVFCEQFGIYMKQFLIQNGILERMDGLKIQQNVGGCDLFEHVPYEFIEKKLTPK